MSNTLCETWQRALAHPEDAAIAGAARARLAEILPHLGECEACAAATDAASDRAEVLFEALGVPGDQLSAEDEAELARIERAWTENEEEIEGAVTTMLLDTLTMQTLQGWVMVKKAGVVRPLDVFLATNAVNMLVYSRASHEPDRECVLTPQGLLQGGELTVRRDAITQHIQRHAPLPAAGVEAMYDWMLQLGAAVPRLFLQFESVSSKPGLVMRVEDSSQEQNLYSRWLPETAAAAVAYVPTALSTHLAAAYKAEPPEPREPAPAKAPAAKLAKPTKATKPTKPPTVGA